MGKVIKGSTLSGERYTVAIPRLVAPGPAPDDLPFDAAWESGAADALPSEPAPESVPAEPAVDLQAIAAQAQALVDDAARESEALLDEARERARVLVEEATGRARSLLDDARREGHDDGYSAGMQAADDATATMLATLRELVESTRGERHALINGAEPELVRLAVGIAERVLHQQIALDHGVVVEMAKAAIARIVDREKITVRVNPADVECMREHRDDLLALGDVKSMLVIEDQRVDRGGVIIETDAGSIDAKISTQLAEVRKILHIVDDIVISPAPLLAVDDAELAARAS